MPKKDSRSEMKKAALKEPDQPHTKTQSDCPLKKKEPAKLTPPKKPHSNFVTPS